MTRSQLCSRATRPSFLDKGQLVRAGEPWYPAPDLRVQHLGVVDGQRHGGHADTEASQHPACRPGPGRGEAHHHGAEGHGHGRPGAGSHEDAEVDKMKTPDLAVLGQCMATRRSLDNKGDER